MTAGQTLAKSSKLDTQAHPLRMTMCIVPFSYQTDEQTDIFHELVILLVAYTALSTSSCIMEKRVHAGIQKALLMIMELVI
jgi:hypothetical protein